MLYNDLTFPLTGKPYFYANFVSTIDGKVQVLTDTERYWPLGSELDYKTLIELRTYADCLIHGSRTALSHPTLKSLSKPEFHQARELIGKKGSLVYFVVTNHPTDALIPKLHSTHPLVKTAIVTSESAKVSPNLESATEILRVGNYAVLLQEFEKELEKRHMAHVLVEGGPTLMGSFFKNGLIDEIFLTIAPKVIGSKNGRTLTMVEDFLFSPDSVPHFSLLSCKQEGQELYLRYRKRGNA